jgi:hypothetical protein
MKNIIAAPAHKDGSVTVELPMALHPVLRSYAETMAAGAADNTGDWGEDGVDARADLNAARGLLRQLERLRGTP